jgi:hypothetical protein
MEFYSADIEMVMPRRNTLYLLFSPLFVHLRNCTFVSDTPFPVLYSLSQFGLSAFICQIVSSLAPCDFYLYSLMCPSLLSSECWVCSVAVLAYMCCCSFGYAICLPVVMCHFRLDSIASEVGLLAARLHFHLSECTSMGEIAIPLASSYFYL